MKQARRERDDEYEIASKFLTRAEEAEAEAAREKERADYAQQLQTDAFMRAEKAEAENEALREELAHVRAAIQQMPININPPACNECGGCDYVCADCLMNVTAPARRGKERR